MDTYLTVIPCLAMLSRQICAEPYVQNVVAINLLEFVWEQSELLVKIYLRWDNS